MYLSVKAGEEPAALRNHAAERDRKSVKWKLECRSRRSVGGEDGCSRQETVEGVTTANYCCNWVIRSNSRVLAAAVT